MGAKHSVEYRTEPALLEALKSTSETNKGLSEAARDREIMAMQLELLTKQLSAFKKGEQLPRSVVERLGKPADVLVKEAKAYYKTHGIDLDMSKLLVAVVGYSCSGKSSLINALRGIRDYDDSAAKVSVTEVFTSPKLYEWNDTMALVDFPGGGTETYKAEEYVEEFKMYCFDVVLVVISGRVRAGLTGTGMIAVKMREFGRTTLCLYNKCDQDVDDILHYNEPGSYDDAGAKRFLRRCTEKSLAKHAPWIPPTDLYLVSAKQARRGVNNFDEALFLERLRKLAAIAAKQA